MTEIEQRAAHAVVAIAKELHIANQLKACELKIKYPDYAEDIDRAAK